MALTPISGEIQAQPLNDNFSYLDSEKQTKITIVSSDYGTVGNGVIDDITALNDSAIAATGDVLVIPKGNYLISSTLSIPDNTTVFAYGARIFNTSSHIYLLSLGSGVKIYGLEIEGAGNTTADNLGRGINIVGADSDNYKSRISLVDCHIHDIGFYGVHMNYVKDVIIESTKIQNVGYAGIMGISVTNVKVDKCHIKGMSPGDNNNAYGVSFSRLGLSSDLSVYPRSKDCSVTNSLIEDNTLWEGIDTHAGENISFVNNIIRNCKIGIAVVASHLSGTDDYAPNDCKVIGNAIYGLGTGYGIAFAGAQGTTGSPTEYTKRGVISGNSLLECGQEGSNTSGAIYIVNTEGLAVSNNTLKDCFAMGINLYHDNKGFSVVGNTVVDVQDSTISTVSGIISRSEYNEGTISGNTLLRVNDALNTYVAERGIYFANTTGIDITIGPNYNNYVTEMSAVEGQVAKFNSLGNNVDLFAGIGSPETVITAPPGSYYINKNGGAGITLYVKESGTGNTGWIGK